MFYLYGKYWNSRGGYRYGWTKFFLKVMEERDFPVDKLYLFASSKSEGTVINFKNDEYIVEELKEDSFDRPMDMVLFSAGGNISKKICPYCQRKRNCSNRQ